jgi:hypothetical protein
MGFFDVLNGGIENLFREAAKSKRLKENRRYNQFKELEHTPFLLDSAYLLELTEGANTMECDVVLDYLYRFNNQAIGEDEHLNILGIESYRSIEQKIIDRRWK